MAENVEEIEAKLAAYVDGELTPAERVEIETHLEANPSHRALLQDLTLHRNLLRSLPREKAPGDCTEGFQGQLERDILLGGNELAQARRRWRIQYSPQLLSAAAIVLVAVALAVIVYSVLPPHQSHPPISQLTTEPAKNGEPVVAESTTLADSRAFKIAGDEAVAKKSAAGASLALNKEAVVGQKLENATFALQDQPQQQVLATAGDMMVITVTADDVKSANEAVVNYLALNKINYTAQVDGLWKDGVDAMAAGRQLTGTSAGAGIGGGGRGGGAFGGADATAAASAQVPAIRASENELAKREESQLRARVEKAQVEAKSDPKSAPAPVEENRLDDKLAQANQPQPQRYAKAAPRPAPTAPDSGAVPTTQPSAVALGGSSGTSGVNETVRAKAGGYGGYNVSTGAVLLQQQKQLPTDQLAEIDAACVVIARDMNGQQVRELARSLSQPERNLFATVQLENADAYRRTTLATLSRADQNDWAMRAPTFGRQLQETELMLKDRAVAANAPAVVGPATRPAAALSLNIKPDEAGLSRVESEKTPNGTVANAEKFHYGVDLSGEAQQVQLPAQQGAFFATNPTTQPLAALKPDVFTCVIVVQNNATARAAGATTQPVAGKPATTAPTEPAPAAKEAK